MQIIQNGIIYSLFTGKWIVGTNDTISGNAIPANMAAPSHIIIPRKVENHKIEEIGQRAFR